MENNRGLVLSLQEALDLCSAISEAQAELCCGAGFPEATAYDKRLEALAERIREYAINS